MLNQHKIGFIGSGNIARCLVGGLLANGISAKNIWVSGRNAQKLSFFKETLGVHTCGSNVEVAEHATILFLCVKPLHLRAVCHEIVGSVMQAQPLLISVAAGATCAVLRNWLYPEASIVRAMPNTPCALGVGVIGLLANEHVTPSQKKSAELLMGSVGMTFWLENDSALDSETALAGSGPAYVFLLMEHLAEAASQAGLSRLDADLMTKQMVLGAARMAMESDQDVVQLRAEVSSRGGATEAAIQAFERKGFRAAVHDAFNAARERSRDIATQVASSE